MPPHVKRVEGRAAAVEFAMTFTTAEDWSIGWEPKTIQVASSGDLVYATGHWHYSFKDTDGHPVKDQGNFLDALKKEGGVWKPCAVCSSAKTCWNTSCGSCRARA